MKFITSLNPHHRIERQLACIQSWRAYNLPIVAVQHESETEVESIFSPDEVIYTTTTPNLFDSTFPSLNSMCAQFPGIIINSDIDLSVPLPEFNSYIRVPGVGIRRELGVLNRFGIDLFSSPTPYLPPENSWVVGKPGWDYYLLLLWHEEFQFFIMDNGLNHEPHPTNWNQLELRLAQRELMRLHSMSQRDVTRKVQRITGRA